MKWDIHWCSIIYRDSFHLRVIYHRCYDQRLIMEALHPFQVRIMKGNCHFGICSLWSFSYNVHNFLSVSFTRTLCILDHCWAFRNRVYHRPPGAIDCDLDRHPSFYNLLLHNPALGYPIGHPWWTYTTWFFGSETWSCVLAVYNREYYSPMDYVTDRIDSCFSSRHQPLLASAIRDSCVSQCPLGFGCWEYSNVHSWWTSVLDCSSSRESQSLCSRIYILNILLVTTFTSCHYLYCLQQGLRLPLHFPLPW